MKLTVSCIIYTLLGFIIVNAQPPDVNPIYKFPYQDGISFKKYKERRERIAAVMSAKSVFIVYSGDYYVKAKGEYFSVRQDPNFYYLTGLPQLSSVLIIAPGGIEIEGQKFMEVLLLEEHDAHSQTWSGPKMNTRTAEITGIEKIVSLSKYDNLINQLSSNIDTVFFLSGNYFSSSAIIETVLSELVKGTDALKKYLSNSKVKVSTLNSLLKKMREVKDEEELRLMERAADITIEAFTNTIKAIKPDMTEYAIQAEMEYNFKKLGAERPAFPSIVGSGPNSCIIHYTSNRDTARSGDLVLMDCGAEYHGYAADVTRTVPVNGKFTEEQERIYNIVLESHDAALEVCRKGKPFITTHTTAIDIITKGLKDEGIITQDSEYRYYMPHGVSHYLGLDVHDDGSYGNLKPGNVITIEPGIYIPAGSPCDHKWWNIGVRIENDVLITDGDPVVITNALPIEPDEIEMLMNDDK